jgi:hypothetical protein
MKVGDLVIVRLAETGTTRFLLPGIIVNKILQQKSGKKRQMYEVLTRGETVCVSDSDLGPINMFADRYRLEEKWNDV